MKNILKSVKISLMICFCALLLVGCGNKNWSPTEPITQTPSTDNITIEDSWSVQIDASK